MNTAKKSAEILDLQAFRKRQTEPSVITEDTAQPMAPVGFAWYPVWVLVPQFTQR